MKHRTLIFLLAIQLALPLCAQSGLHVSALFEGQYRNRNDATEVIMKGKRIRQYKLTLFRSLTLNTRTVNTQEIERLVRADAANALDKEAGMKGGRLYYGFYRLRPVGHTNRYLFYRNNALKPGGGHNATLTIIYLEGTASIEELKKLFGQ